MSVSVDPVSQVLAALAKFDAVQKSAVSEGVEQTIRVIKATHEQRAALAGDGQGQHVDVTV